MKKYAMLASLLAVAFMSSAGIVPLTTAKKAALNFYSERILSFNKTENTSFSITSQEVIGEPGLPLLYVFNINEGKGFVLVAAEEGSVPVVGYSFEGSFRTDAMPAVIEDWISNYAGQVKEIRDLGLLPDAESQVQWERYASADFSPAKDLMAVNPLLTTNWDQGCYYNALCPIAAGGDCNRAWAGCVATAMGMVMKYHNYPAQGSGSHTYVHPTYGTLSANFGNTAYQWSSMPNTLWSNNNAVATLLYHCGISVDMNYGPSGSGAYTQDVRNALINYFNYSSNAQYVQKLWYSVSDWENLLRTNLDSHRPVIYSGQDPSYGHAFVCDGYQGTNYFHFNWGWSGWNNGYFYVSNLNSGNGTFNNNQAAVVNVAPANAPTAEFMASVTAYCNSANVQFWDLSMGSLTSWNWQFPGGNPSSSNQQNPTVYYPNPGLYNVTLTVSNGSSSHTITKSGYIRVLAPPQGIFPTDTTICCNHTITLDAGNPGSSYTWSTGGNSQFLTVDSSGTGIGEKKIFVDILTPEGCWNLDSIRIVFASCFSVEEKAENRLMVYPNPASGHIMLDLPGQASEHVLRVYNPQGMLVHEDRNNDGSSAWQVDLSFLPKGPYLLQLISGSQSSRSWLMLQ
ncbi:MAG TPA: C10 family peptidase [Bacteroidales bacterium]|nr:C10 family peptidase [Bacteroidales bacterium]HSA42919.1 C10 family peptidase [Bacteroidales bacterium]